MFTLKEVMEMLNIPERTIRRHIKLGLLKGEKLGGAWRFSEEDLTNYFSTSMFKQNQNNIKYHEVFDALNGIVEFPNEVLIVKNIKKLGLAGNKELSKYTANFTDHFYFNLDTKFSSTIVTFKGREEDAILLLEYLNNL